MNSPDQERIPYEQKVAALYLSLRGILRPEHEEESGVPNLEIHNSVLSEGYDLFIEREQLQDFIEEQRVKIIASGFLKQQLLDLSASKASPLDDIADTKASEAVFQHALESFMSGELTSSLTFEQKSALILQGKISKLMSGMTELEAMREVVNSTRGRIAVIDAKLEQLFSEPGVYGAFYEDLSRQVRARQRAREIKQLRDMVDQLFLKTLRVVRNAQTLGRATTSVERKMAEENRILQDTARDRVQELLNDPDVYDQSRIFQLKEYQIQLKKDGFVETPSRLVFIRKLERLWGQNKKVLLTGATGTGKTELVRHASGRFFGIIPFQLTGHQDMTPYEILGKTGMVMKAGDGSDVYRPSQLIQAMIARNGQGAPFLFDEVDAATNEALMAMKSLLNDGPGDEVRLQMDSGGKVVIGNDFSFTATANVKGIKHTTRTELDPAIVRVFDSIKLPYLPPDEVWDICVASLLDNRGGLLLSSEEAGNTLKNLCDAAYWIQQAYLGEKVILEPGKETFLEARGGATTGKWATLKEAVLDPGRVIKMLKGWEVASLNGQSFVAFLDEQLIGFINNENYPEEDRYYLIRIFALKGFLKTANAEVFLVKDLTTEVLNRWRGSGSVSRLTPQVGLSYLSPKRVARLDPYGKLKRPVSLAAEELLEEELRVPAEVQVTANQMIDRAKELLGQDFLGVEALQLMEEQLKATGVDVEFLFDDMPAFPYTEADLIRAKEEGEMVVLRPGKIKLNGKVIPLTIHNLINVFEKDPRNQIESFFYNPSKSLKPKTGARTLFAKPSNDSKSEPPWYLSRTFIHDLIPQDWTIIRKQPLPESVGMSFSNQKTVIDQANSWLKKRGCTEARMPRAYEVIWALIFHYMIFGERLLPDGLTFTNSVPDRDHTSTSLTIGSFNVDGIKIGKQETYEGAEKGLFLIPVR